MTALESRKTDGDLVLVEFDRAYNRVSETIKNTAGGAVTLDRERFVGYPVKGAAGARQLALAADVASITGLMLMSHRPSLDLAATTGESDYEYGILVRGPAVVNESALETDDYAGDPFTMATLKTRLGTLGIVVASPPPETEVQTT